MTNELPRLTRNHDGDLLLLVGETTTLVAKVGTPLWEAIVSAATPPAPAAPVNVAASKEFDEWWDQSGQFIRAGGGDYEKTFAFNAWNAALAATQQAEPAADYSELPELVDTFWLHSQEIGADLFVKHSDYCALRDWVAQRLVSKESTSSAAEPTMLNGLTEAQTSATASVAGVDSQTPASTGVVSQKPVEVDDNPWLPHNGGPCPVEPHALVDVRLREMVVVLERARAWRLRWLHQNNMGDIIEYRLHLEGGE